MPVTAEVLEILNECGVTFANIVRIVRAIEDSEQRYANVTRNRSSSGAAERMKRLREKRKAEANSDANSDANSQNPTLVKKVSSREESKEDKKKGNVGKRHNSELFETFWKSYPTDKLMSKKDTATQWAKLSPEDQQAAIAALPAFRAEIPKQGPNYRIVHACRFLSQRRFEGFAEIAHAAPINGKARRYVKHGTDEWDDLEKSFLASHGKKPPIDQHGGWWFEL